MTFQCSLLKERGVEFAIVLVKLHILSSSNIREEARKKISCFFPGVPVILMAQNSRGIPQYHGRTDIVKFLATIDFRKIPWKKYTI